MDTLILDQRSRLGALHRVAWGSGGRIATVEPLGASYRLRNVPELDPTGAYRLSRFAFIRRHGDEAVLESPPVPRARGCTTPAWRRCCCPSPGRRRSRRCRARLPGPTPPSYQRALLMAEGFVGRAGTDGVGQGEGTVPLRQWEFQDLLFHTRSRLGRHRTPAGGTYRFRGLLPPLPAAKPPLVPRPLPRPRPDLAAVAVRDARLVVAMEMRTSVRRYGPVPITLTELGEFLFRANDVRIEQVWLAWTEDPDDELARRLADEH